VSALLAQLQQASSLHNQGGANKKA